MLNLTLIETRCVLNKNILSGLRHCAWIMLNNIKTGIYYYIIIDLCYNIVSVVSKPAHASHQQRSGRFVGLHRSSRGRRVRRQHDFRFVFRSNSVVYL